MKRRKRQRKISRICGITGFKCLKDPHVGEKLILVSRTTVTSKRQIIDVELNRLKFKYQILHLLAVQPGSCYLTSLSISFFIWKMKGILKS